VVDKSEGSSGHRHGWQPNNKQAGAVVGQQAEVALRGAAVPEQRSDMVAAPCRWAVACYVLSILLCENPFCLTSLDAGWCGVGAAGGGMAEGGSCA
jgi:hypothetical protein